MCRIRGVSACSKLYRYASAKSSDVGFDTPGPIEAATLERSGRADITDIQTMLLAGVNFSKVRVTY